MKIYDCTLTDVASGAVKRPREPQPGESLTAWLAEMPAGRNIDLTGAEPLDRTPKRFERLGLVIAFRRGDDLIAVNEDGTRFAIETRSATLAVRNLLDAISNEMRTQGITQTEIATRTGIRQTQISEILAGKFTPSIERVERIANVLNWRLAFEEIPE